VKRILIVLVLAPLLGGAVKKKAAAPVQTPLDRYIDDARSRQRDAAPPTPGAIWSPTSRLADAAGDVRASQVDDILTILVVENASAVASGTTKTQRATSATAAVNTLGGITRAAGPLANLAGMTGNQQLAGTGTTTRDVVISTTLTARVAAVMPNGNLIVEASKDIGVNSERQTIVVRGVVRLADIASSNIVRSDHLGQLEVHVNGKGVVGDAIRRPFFLYRLLLGLLPF
jgi:flagellar L-ring protein precursor FlgH